MKKIKAQISLEFLILVSVAMTILTFSVYSYYSNTIEANRANFVAQAGSICQEIKDVVNNVIANGNGFAVSFDLPEEIQGKKYSATVYGSARFVEISFDSEVVICNTATGNVTNSTSAVFQLNAGKNIATNSNGQVIIN